MRLVIPLPYKLLAAAALLAVTFLSGAGFGRSWERGQQAQRDLVKQDEARELARIESKADGIKAADVLSAQARLRAQIADLRTKGVTHAPPVDRAACLEPERVLDLQTAINAANRAAAGPGGPVPAAADTAGR